MIEVCDPDVELDVLKKLIKIHTGHSIKLTKKQTCQVFDDIRSGNVPLPPLIMSSDKTYLLDKKSPLTPGDYETLFDTSSKRVDIKRVARKVGIRQMDQMTKSQMIDSIGKRLRYMKVHEPVKIGTKRTAPGKVNNVDVDVDVNNTAVNRSNNVNRANNTAVNRVNNTAVNNVNRSFNTNTSVNTRAPVPRTRVNFPKGSLFMTGQKPKFLNGQVSAVKQPTQSIFAGLKQPTGSFFNRILKPKQANFMPSDTFTSAKTGYAFKTGNQGTGYYINTDPLRVQGPMLKPKVLNVPNVPTNIELNNAINKIQKLQLKREQPFINKVKAGVVKRSNVLDEAVKYKTLETNFITKIEKMSLSNTNRTSIIDRMTTEDLQQLEAEATLKSGALQNNEQKMNIILATLPFINNASKLTFKARSKAENANINSLIEEAKTENETKRTAFVSDQKKKFMGMVVNVKLSDGDKTSLEDLIDNKTNLNSLKVRADNLVEQRKKEKNALIKQDLLAYLTPLKINQTNKNSFLTRFNKGESIDALKRAAKQREEEVLGGQGENARTRLVRNLNALNLNAQNKNTIMGKFNNGNKNVTKLVEEAKTLKGARNSGKLDTERQRLLALAKQLGVNENMSKLNSLNNVSAVEARIREAGAEKVQGTFAAKVRGLSTLASMINLNANIQSDILKLKNNTDLNAMKVRVMSAGKTKLSNRAKSLNVNFSKNIQKLNTVNKLVPLQQKINDTGAAKQGSKKQKEAARVAQSREQLKSYISVNTILPQNKRNAFVRQVNLNNTNLLELRKEINSEIQKVKNTKRSKNIDELKQYLQPLNIDKLKFIQRFETTNISLENIKVAVNKEVASKGDLNSKKRALSDKINTAKSYDVAFNFNTNTNKLNSEENIDKLNRTVDTTIEGAVNRGRNALSNKIIDAKLTSDFMNKVTNVKTLKNLNAIQKQVEAAITTKSATNRDEIVKYAKQLRLTNEEIERVTTRETANTILDQKKRLELTELLNKENVPVTNRQQFYNKITKNSRISNIQANITAFMKKKSKENVTNVETVLDKYNLKPEDREALLNNWDAFENMTVVNLKNKASTLSSQYKKEKEIALRRHLKNDLNLANDDINTIMRNFDANPRNMNALHEKVKELKGASGEKVRLTERIRKAREENKLNLKFNVNKENLKTLNAKINQAYIGKGKKDLARRALDRNINISNNLNAIKSLNNVQKLKNKLNGLIGGKRNEDLRKLEEVLGNLNQENKNRFLQKFKNENNSLNAILQNVQKFKNSKVTQKVANQKQELYRYLDETLNLNVKDRNSILFEFNNTKNLDAMKQKANALKKTRTSEKIVENRKKLEELLKSMNLTEENKVTLLAKFDNAPGNLESFEANAKSLVQQRKGDKRTGERGALMNYMDSLGLSGQNKNMIVGFFDQSPNKTLESSKNNATSTKQTRNQEKLENALKNLSSISENNKTKLRTNLQSGTAVNTVLSSAKRMNANAQSKKYVEQSIINYVSSKNLGTNGNKLITNFKNGLLTANKVKEEADKKRVSLNAEIVTNKKMKLREFMKNTLLSNQDKNKYIDRVQLDTKMNNLEKNIQRVDEDLKSKRNTFARKQTELRTFLDGLTNLSSNQVTKFMGRVKNKNTDIDRIKREAESIDKAKKAGKKKTEERAKPKEENTFNTNKALNILNKQRAGEAKRIERAEPKEDNTFNANKAVNNLNKQRNEEAKAKNILNKQKDEEAKKALNILNKQRAGEAKRLERAEPKEENNFNANKAVNNLNKQKAEEAKKAKENKNIANASKSLVAGAIGKIQAKNNLNKQKAKENKNIANASKSLVAGAIGKIQAKENAVQKSLNLEPKHKAILNKISKYTNQRITNFRSRAANPFRSEAELNKTNAEVNAMIKLVDDEKIRKGVEFKIKQIEGLTNADVTEFMNKWKNKTVFNQARKRGAGRLAGKTKTEERAKVGDENTFNSAGEMNRLNLLKKAKDQVARFGGRIGKWDPAIKNAKNSTALTNLEKKLNKKVELRKEIKASQVGAIRKRGHLEKVMQLYNDVDRRRKLFEQQLANIAGNTKKRELSKYIVGLNLPAKNKSNYVKQTNKPGANLNMIRVTVNKQIPKTNTKGYTVNVSNVNPLFAEPNKGEKFKVSNVNPLFAEPKPPNAPQPNKPSFRALVQKNKEKRVMNAVKVAGKKVALSRSSGPERVKMARNLAPAKQENVKKVVNAVKLFNRQSATSTINRLKKLTPAEKTRYKGQIGSANTKAVIKEIQESAVRMDARKKFEENAHKKAEVPAVTLAPKPSNRQSATSTINRLKKLTPTEKTKYKGQIGRANTQNRIKEIRVAAEKAAESAKRMLRR